MRQSLYALFVVLSLAALSAAQVHVTVQSPASGTTVGSPVQFAATATSSHPITGFVIYANSQNIYKMNSSSLNASVSLAAGTYSVLIRAWDSTGAYGTSPTLSITVGSTSGVHVTVQSPTSGATVGSPVNFAATATSAHPIAGFMVYANNRNVYQTSSSNLSGSASLAAGTYSVLVRAWDSTGAYGTSAPMSITVGTRTSGAYTNVFNAASTWEVKIQASSGAIYDGYSYTTNKITPYFANLSAIGWVLDPTKHADVLHWMQWYINHLNWPDKYGLYGTTYDYSVSSPDGPETSLGSMDSTDSYAATFLSLAWAAWQTGDSNLQAYIKSITYQLDVIGGVDVLTMQSDGLTWALPDYKIKYLEDNTEVYRGLKDLSSLFAALGYSTKASYYAAIASQALNGLNSMWMSGAGAWAVYKDGYGNLAAPKFGTWYPDATSQLYPVVNHLVSAGDPRSQTVYAKFNNAYPSWDTLSFPSSFPWALVGYAASQYGDTSRAKTYINSVDSKYVYNGFLYPWMSMENGFFLRMTTFMNQ